MSVYLPTWRDTVAWARREPDLLARLKAGYPRFFVPLVVQELEKRLLEWTVSKQKCDTPHEEPTAKLSAPEQLALLFPNEDLAETCRRYLETHKQGTTVVLHVTWDGRLQVLKDGPSISHRCGLQDLYAVVYPQELASEGKAFWQHTGYGISSRCATFWLENAPFFHGPLAKHGNIADLPLKEAEEASVILRRRIGGLLSSTANEVGMEAVYLYPTGMSAISHTAAALSSLRSDGQRRCRVAVFG